MKKLNLSFILVVIFFTACSRLPEDKVIIDDTIYDTSGEIVNKWICQEVTADGKEPVLKNEETGQVLLEAQAVGVSQNVNYSITFFKDPNKITSEGGFDLKITINFVGVLKVDPIEEFLEKPSLLGDGDWVRNSETHTTITTDVRVVNATIVELTETSLILKAVLEDFHINYDNKDYYVDINTKMKFIKA